MRRIFISLVMALALVSCSTDELSSGGNGSQKGKVQLVLSTDGFDEVESRAVDIESVIHDINILEYKKGALVKQVYLDKDDGVDFSKAVEVSGLEDLDATLLDNKAGDTEDNAAKNGIENFIFVVANYGKQIGSAQVSPLATLEDFKMEFTGKKDLAYLPMTGFYYGGINANSTTQMNVTLQRAVAKVSFTLDTSSFKVGGKTPSLLIVNSIKLCNVPNEVTLYPKQPRPSLPRNGETVNWNSTEDATHVPFPTASEMDNSVTYDDAQNQSSDANTYVAYIPENVRGSYSAITNNKDKHPSKCDITEEAEKNDKSYTYILVDLDYAPSDGTAKNVKYKIYLGGNSTGDMNLLRNTQYNVTTSLYGAGVNDTETRITVTDASNIMVLAPANCYMIDMSDITSDSKKIIIPLSQVNNGWAEIAKYDKTQTTTASDIQTILESGNWEIQTEWRTWENGSNITGTKIADFSASNLKAVLTIPADVKNGNNAVVKLVSKADGKTYWSWHLWFTDYKPSATDCTAKNGQVHKYFGDAFQSGIYKEKYMMDRNLGATVTITDTKIIDKTTGAISQPSSTEDAIKCYGLVYEFGRKDPFIGSNGKNQQSSTYNDFIPIYNDTGTQIKNSKTPFKIDGPADLANSVYNPSTFFYGSDSNNYDWLSSNPKDANLWSGQTVGTSKSVFDPCPPGWRVPLSGTTATNNPWAGFRDGSRSPSATDNGDATWNGFGWKEEISGQPGTAGRLYNYPSTNGTQAWYPASGFISYITGTSDAISIYGYVWSATSVGQHSYFLSFGSSFVKPSDNYRRAHGFPVRCIQE